MSALAAEHGWAELVRIWERTDAPEGCKVEIIEGIVTVAPPPTIDHNFVAAKIQRRLNSVLPEDVEVHQTLAVSVPGRSGLFIPDLAVFADSSLQRPGNRVPASEALLVVEITSASNAKQDRTAKLWGYAHAGVPLYLLVDAWANQGPAVTLHSEPAEGDYRKQTVVSFGELLTLPKPFDLVLDTSVFPTEWREPGQL